MAEAVLSIRVIPRAKRSAITGMRDGAWVVRLQAPPVEGAANDALMALLAATLGVPKRAVSIVSGETSRQKRVRVAGMDTATAQELLHRVIG